MGVEYYPTNLLMEGTPATPFRQNTRLPCSRLLHPPGVVSLVTHVADGSTKSETTPARHLPTSGDRPLDAVIMDERRDGPRWLCDDDDEPPHGHIWDVMLVWRQGRVAELSLCIVHCNVYCCIIMLRNSTSSSNWSVYLIVSISFSFGSVFQMRL